jgi:ATP synthase F1 delta subunit
MLAYLKVANPYAKALFQAAVKASELKEAMVEFNSLIDFKEKNHELINKIFASFVGPKTKLQTAQAISKHLGFKTCIKNFLPLIAQAKRVEIIESCHQIFCDLFNNAQQKMVVTLVVNKKSDAKIKNLIIKMLEKATSKKVELTEKINKDILGGFILEYKSGEIDNSLKTKLNKLEKLANTELTGYCSQQK